jgi:hypothetical protein
MSGKRKSARSRVRSAKTGRYVRKSEATKHPNTTVTEQDRKRKKS